MVFTLYTSSVLKAMKGGSQKQKQNRNGYITSTSNSCKWGLFFQKERKNLVKPIICEKKEHRV